METSEVLFGGSGVFHEFLLQFTALRLTKYERIESSDLNDRGDAILIFIKPRMNEPKRGWQLCFVQAEVHVLVVIHEYHIRFRWPPTATAVAKESVP